MCLRQTIAAEEAIHLQLILLSHAIFYFGNEAYWGCLNLYRLVASEGTVEMNTPHLEARRGMLTG